MSDFNTTTLTGYRYLFVWIGQLVGGFATAALVLYAFLLAFGGPELLLGYFNSILPGLYSGDPFVAGFAIFFGGSPILAVGFQLARHMYSTSEWMKSTRSAFFLGILLGVSVVAFYILMLLISLAPPGTYGPGSGGGGGL